MMIAPAQPFAPAVIARMAATTRLGGHLLVAPRTGAAPVPRIVPPVAPAASAPVAAQVPPVVATDAPVTDHALLGLRGHLPGTSG